MELEFFFYFLPVSCSFRNISCLQYASSISTLPFAGALIFGYTRIRLGLGYAIALHILWNFLSSFRLFIN